MKQPKDSVGNKQQKKSSTTLPNTITWTEYRSHAEKLLAYFTNKYRSCAWLLSNNEELIGDIIEAIVSADKKWDEKLGRNYRSYRYIAARFCVLNYIKAHYKFYGQFKRLDEANIVFEPEAERIDIYDILDKCTITNNERRFIEYYYLNNMTLQEIGDKFGCSAQNVQQTIDRGIKAIQATFN